MEGMPGEDGIPGRVGPPGMKVPHFLAFKSDWSSLYRKIYPHVIS